MRFRHERYSLGASCIAKPVLKQSHKGIPGGQKAKESLLAKKRGIHWSILHAVNLRLQTPKINKLSNSSGISIKSIHVADKIGGREIRIGRRAEDEYRLPSSKFKSRTWKVENENVFFLDLWKFAALKDEVSDSFVALVAEKGILRNGSGETDVRDRHYVHGRHL